MEIIVHSCDLCKKMLDDKFIADGIMDNFLDDSPSYLVWPVPIGDIAICMTCSDLLEKAQILGLVTIDIDSVWEKAGRQNPERTKEKEIKRELIYKSVADLQKTEAIMLALNYGYIDGGHHKMWVIDQMLRALLGDDYESKIPKDWDTGISP